MGWVSIADSAQAQIQLGECTTDFQSVDLRDGQDVRPTWGRRTVFQSVLRSPSTKQLKYSDTTRFCPICKWRIAGIPKTERNKSSMFPNRTDYRCPKRDCTDHVS